jgi:uncharacterized protein YqjF (DUF2071 family)
MPIKIPKKMSFLKAEWRKLVIANYIIDPELLSKYLPFGTELDLWENKCFVSVVGFMFQNTKLLGIKIPFHVNFEEVNLRFYVKRKEKGEWKRGVVFIKEIVPRRALTFVANTFYNENYETLPMEHHWGVEESEMNVHYRWLKNGKWNSVKVRTEPNKLELENNSETEFITEHYWGYAKVNSSRSNEYEVRHPRWEIYKVNNYKIDIDFGGVYGSEFEYLKSEEPASVILAEGSLVSVENKKTIK